MSYSNQQKGKGVFYQQQPHPQRIRYPQQQRPDEIGARPQRFMPQQAPRPQHPVPSQSPRIPSPSVSPVAVNTLTHDMSKQGAPSRPAMAASPQQGILPNQPNPGPMINMSQVRFPQAPRQALPRGYQQQIQQQVYSPLRHQTQAQMQSMQQHPQAGGPATQQGANTVQIVQSSAAAAAASGQYMQQGGTQFIMPGAMPIVQGHQMAHRSFQQTYPQVFQPTAPQYYSSSPQQQVFSQYAQPTPRPQFNTQPPAPRPESQRSKSSTRIVIQDPSTMQDVTDTILRDTSRSSSPHSGRSSANVTPPVSTSSEDAKRIQAQFASKVAMVASDLPESDLPQPHRVPPQPAPQQPQTQQQPPQQQPPVPQPIPQQLAMQPPQQPGQQVLVKPVGPGEQPVPVVAGQAPAGGNFPVIAPGAAPVVAQLPSRPVEPTVPEGAQNTVVAATPVAEAIQPQRPVPQAVVPAPVPSKNPVQMQQVPTEAMPLAVPPPQNPAPVPAAAAAPPAGPPANVQAASVQEAAAPSKHEPASANTASAAEKASPPEQQAPDGAAVPPPVQPTPEPNPKQVDDGSKQTSANTPAVQQATPVPAVPQPESQEATATPQESKDIKKKSQKKRFQELDKKTTKGSDEFDAYKTDDVQEPTPSQENPGKEKNVEFEPEAKVSMEPAKEIVQDVSSSEKPKETTQPQEEKKSTEKTDDAPQSDVAKRKSEKESVVSEKQTEVAVVPDTTAPAKLDTEEKSDRFDATEDRENVNEADTDNVESENSKNKEGKPNPKDNKMQLKYAYREDQWSPVNPEGKKQYDRDFLLQFQKGCTDKPDGLPNIPDIVLDRAVVQTMGLNINQGGNQKNTDFMPSFMKSPRVPGKQPNYPTNPGRRSSREPLKVIQRARDSNETKLATSEKAWKAGYKRAPEDSKDDEVTKTQELFRNFTSILNKLTPQMFNKLTDKALQLPIDTEDRLTGVINLVFEKAIGEPSFSTAYAHMCQKLGQLKVQSVTNPGSMVQFRPILLHSCQQEFEKEKQTEIDEATRRKEISQLPAKEQELQLELLQEKLSKAKRRTMGNIRFIGELYKLNILTENIMHSCVMKLLKARDDDSLECLCNLMATIGKNVDHEKAKNRIDQYFSKIDKIIASQTNQPRIRFLMCDLVDLRRNNWVPRRQENKPTTIDAIHREWHVAEAKKAEEHKNYNGPNRSREQAPPPRTVTPQADDGWNTVPITTSKTRTAYDPNKLKLTRMTTADDNIQLGPGGRGFSTWGRGSIGASTKNKSTSDSASSSQEDSAPTQANRFSMLSEDAKRPVSRDSRGGGYGSRDSRDGKRPSRERDREREKEAAIAEVQRISRPSRPERPEQPRGSKEMAPRPEKKKEPTMTDDKVKQTSKATVDEFLNLRDFTEATRCVSELPSKQRHIFVQATVDHVIEKKQDMREAVGALFHSLLNSNILTKEQYLTGMKDMIEFADDMAIDIPKIFEYLGELMGAMVLGAEYLQLQATAVKPLREQEKDGVLLAEILRTASRKNGASKVCHIWQQANLKWKDFLSEGENVQEFVQKKGVDFTLDGASATDNGLNSVSSQGDWLQVFNTGLTNLLNGKDRPDNNKIFDWIEHNVADTQKQHSEFIRALVTIICQNAAEGEEQNCRVDPAILKQRGPVLQRYIDNKRPLELQALYAVQALNHSLHSPPGLLRILFDVLYDEDVASEDAFYDWKKSEDPKESTGKGVALKSVTSFFTWLAEAD